MTENAVYGAHWRKLRLLVLERDGWLCQIRGPKCKVTASEVDHVVPWRAGGSWYDPENLRGACVPCNRGRPCRKVWGGSNPSREW